MFVTKRPTNMVETRSSDSLGSEITVTDDDIVDFEFPPENDYYEDHYVDFVDYEDNAGDFDEPYNNTAPPPPPFPLGGGVPPIISDEYRAGRLGGQKPIRPSRIPQYRRRKLTSPPFIITTASSRRSDPELYQQEQNYRSINNNYNHIPTHHILDNKNMKYSKSNGGRIRNGSSSPPPLRPSDNDEQQQQQQQRTWGFGPPVPPRGSTLVQDYDIANGGTNETWNSPSRRERVNRRSIVGAPAPRLLLDDEDYYPPGSHPRSRLIESSADDYYDNYRNIGPRYKDSVNAYKAFKITVYKNGDPWSEGIDFVFRPGRDIISLESFLAKISMEKKRQLDLRSGVECLFDTDGMRITSVDEIENGGTYVVSETRKFIPGNYGRIGNAFNIEPTQHPPIRNNSRNRNKYPHRSGGSNKSGSSSGSSSKPGSGDGKIVKVINDLDRSVQYEVLLNLKTTQPFEEILKDMGQVLKLKNADLMFTKDGKLVRGFSQLKNEFSRENAFIIASSGKKAATTNLTRVMSEPSISSATGRKISSRASNHVITNYNIEPIKVTIKGNRKLFYPPSDGYKESILPPPNRLIMDWVYGYRGADVHENLWVLDGGELLYYVAAIVIIYNRIDETQTFYTGHTEDITCLSLHPEREVVVSGQLAGKSGAHETRCHLRVWSVKTLETIVVMGFGECDVSLTEVEFSSLNGGNFICAVDESPERILSVWDWKNSGNLLGRVATHQENLKGCAFHPLDNNLLITYGQNILTFWSRRKDGFFERTDVIGNAASNTNTSIKKKNINCITFLESGDLVTGDDEGMISIFTVSNEGEYFMSHEYDAHSKGINCLFMLTEGTMISGGDKDRRVVAWDTARDFNKIIETKLAEGFGSARTIISQYPGRNDGNIYIGTTKNIILEGSLQRKFNMVLWGHSNKIEAVDSHPDDLAFITAGYDKIVAKWRKQKLIWKLSVQTECTSCNYHPMGSVIAVGTVDGHVVILNAENGAHVTTIRVCGSTLNSIAFSPDGENLAAVSQNGSIYLFKVSRDGFHYKKYGKLGGGAPLLHIDWSVNCENFRTVSSDYNLVFWNIKTHKMEKVASNLRDILWRTQTCTMGFDIAGLWNNLNYKNDPSEPTSVHSGTSNTLLVSSDQVGYLRLFQFPTVSPKSEFIEQKVITGPFTGLRLFFDDTYLVSVGGGKQATVIRWRIR